MSDINKNNEDEEVIKLNPTKKEIETKLKLKYILIVVIVCLLVIMCYFYKELNRVDQMIHNVQENKVVVNNEEKTEEKIKEEKMKNIVTEKFEMLSNTVLQNTAIVQNDVDILKMTVNEVTDMLLQDSANIVENADSYFDSKADEYMKDATQELDAARDEFLNSVDVNNLTQKEEQAMQMLNAVEEMLTEFGY